MQRSRTTKVSRIVLVTLAVLGGVALLLTAAWAAGPRARAWSGDRSGLLAPGAVAEWRSPQVDVAALLRQDEADRDRTDIPLRIGFAMQVDLSPLDSGTWERLPGGGQLWRLRVVTEGALWTVLGFDRFHLQPGGALSVYDPAQTTVLGPFTSEDVRPHGELWFPPIAGDTLIVELYWPAELTGVEPAIHLGTVSHGYKPFGVIGREEDSSVGTRGFGDSGSCNIDVACPEGADWQDQKRGVVILLSGGSGFCTGSLINTTADDCRPYVLTASHCGAGASTTIGFNFERPGCNSGTPPPETNQTMTGATVLGNYSSSDFTLLEMDNAVPESYGAYFSGWSHDSAPAQNTHVIHHPNGDAKKISFDADPPVDGSNWGPNHWRIDDSSSDPAHRGYEWGTTEPGSSGSPLFDQDHRIVGQLHGGSASCSSDTYDEYGKVAVSWTGGGTPSSRLSDWLDPLGTGAVAIDGIDHQTCLYQPAGEIQFTRDLYSCSDVATVTLRDDNIPGSPASVNVSVSSDTEVAPETLALAQVQPGTGRYEGTLPTTAAAPVNGDGQLSVSHGDVVTVAYVDADDGAGGMNVTVTDDAGADCQPPVISNVQSTDVTGNSARITWDTDEPADSAVTHGLTPPPGTTESDGTLVSSHDLRITGLEECSMHYYSVASADAVGNASSDDAGGSFYTLETLRNVNPEYSSTDTPVAIPDDNPTGASSTITVPDNRTVLDVDVVVNVTHTYDGDLTLSLITPTNATIVLSNRRGSGGNNFTGTRFDDEAATPIASGSAPFSGSFRPDQPLTAADGILAAGNWTLKVVDQAGSDVGTLDSWSLLLTYPSQACGPHASYRSTTTQDDVCSTGGPGAGNGYWDAGEQVQFSLTLDNDGTDPLTGVTVQVVPQTAGVVMLDGLADYDDMPEGGQGTSLPPHFTAMLPSGMTCGDALQFDVQIDSNEGNWAGSFDATAGEIVPGGGTALAEDFEGGLPAGWTVVDGSNDGFTWYLDNASDPAGCGNTDPSPPIAGNWMIADSDCAGSGVTMDEQLVTPTIDLSAALSATLEFDHWFRWYSSGLDEKGDVDVRSSLTGGQWVNVARWQGAESANPEHASIDITAQAAGASDVEIRWHYYDAEFEWTWSVDNVVVSYTAPGGCNMPVCAASPNAPPPIPDGSPGTSPLLADRADATGSVLLLSWDDQCPATATKVLYGPLEQVASWSVGGAECAVTTPLTWDPVPAGNLWFVVVAEDGSGTEGSWGVATAGERNGSAASATCGCTVKDLSGSCP